MTRSRWKPVFITRDIRKLLSKGSSSTIYTYSRRSTIVSELVGRRCIVYTGKAYKAIPFTISTNMVGHKLGEFSITKLHGGQIHKDNKIARKSKKRLKQLLAQKQKRRSKKIKNKRAPKGSNKKMKRMKKK